MEACPSIVSQPVERRMLVEPPATLEVADPCENGDMILASDDPYFIPLFGDDEDGKIPELTVEDMDILCSQLGGASPLDEDHDSCRAPAEVTDARHVRQAKKCEMSPGPHYAHVIKGPMKMNITYIYWCFIFCIAARVPMIESNPSHADFLWV